MDIEADECAAHPSQSKIYEVLNGDELNKGLDNMATDMTTNLITYNSASLVFQ